MAEPKFGIRIFSLAEANSLIPKVKGDLIRLRALRKQIVANQARVDIAEMTSGRSSGPEIDELLKSIESEVHAFHKGVEELHSLGCELKDLEKGLVDFYGMHQNDVVYFCWMDGEEEISHWHSLDSGFKGRKKIDE